jgi:hypothetical protein
MEYEERGRRRRRNNIVRDKGKSKQQIKKDIENFIKENIVKDCYNRNKDQVLVEMEGVE